MTRARLGKRGALLAAALSALHAACTQTIDVLGPAPQPAPAGAGAGAPQLADAGSDSGLVPDPDGPGEDPPEACDACGVAQLCAIDRCLDAAAVDSLSMSLAHVCRVAQGQLFCWGEGEHGKLGTGDEQNRDAPARVGSFNDWLQVSAGESSTCAVRAPGVAYCWGDNSSGQLGLGDVRPRNEPSAVALPALVREVACGGDSCCAIDEHARLYCWGDNLEGKPGQGDRYGAADVRTPLPVQVMQDARFAAVAVGQGHVCAIEQAGSLWCWGRNTNGQLGIGEQPGQVREPERVGSASDWTAIAGSQHHSCGVRADGGLWCWGDNPFFEVAGPDPAARYAEPRQVGAELDWAAVASGWFHNCALKSDGRLACWGRAIEGQLGQDMPIAGQLLELEGFPVPEPSEVPSPARWRRVVAGNFQTCGVDADGVLLCWGDNAAGQLGLGDQERRQLPEPVLP